jgi:hypothetical protein
VTTGRHRSAVCRQLNPAPRPDFQKGKESSENLEAFRLLQHLKESEAENARLVEEIAALKHRERDQEDTIRDLLCAFSGIKLLYGLIPICSGCKKIRDDTGSWNILESYIRTHSEAEFTHGLCPECERQLYPQLFKNKEARARPTAY